MFIFTLSLSSTLSVQSKYEGNGEQHTEANQRREEQVENISGTDIQRLEEMLQAERGERGRLELELEKLRREKEMLEEKWEQERGRSFCMLALHLLQFDNEKEWI